MTGASEALMALICYFAGPGANIVLPKPVYPAVPMLARAWGIGVREYALDPQRAFAQDAATVLAAVDDSTRAVFVNTPHNPTGSVMPAAEQRKLAEALASRGIPLIVDEVYHPLYFDAPVPSASGIPGTIVLGDFAKALSLPGLRIGWLVERDPERRAAYLDLRSYFSISCSILNEAIGAHALANADAILGRLETVARANLALLTSFMRKHADVIGFPAPAGGTTCFPCFRDGRDARPSAPRSRRKACSSRPATVSTCRPTCAWASARSARATRRRWRSSGACWRAAEPFPRALPRLLPRPVPNVPVLNHGSTSCSNV